jgi:hypothetical protein
MRMALVVLIVACPFPVVSVAAQDLVRHIADTASGASVRHGIGVSHWVRGGVCEQDARPEPSIARPIVFGALLGAGSWVAGGLIGYEIANTDSCSGDSFCGLGAFLLGAAIGGSSGLVVGMHLGNNRRGNFPLAWLTSLGIWGAGIGIVFAMDDGVASSGGQHVVWVAIPVAQFAFTLLVERATGRSRAQRDGSVGLAVVPRPDGGLGLGLSFPLR